MKNYGMSLNRNKELDIMFDLLESLSGNIISDASAASICATDINREISLKRIDSESVEFIGMLIDSFAPSEKGYVVANTSYGKSNQKIKLYNSGKQN